MILYQTKSYASNQQSQLLLYFAFFLYLFFIAFKFFMVNTHCPVFNPRKSAKSADKFFWLRKTRKDITPNTNYAIAIPPLLNTNPTASLSLCHCCF
jgi:hypothetical protein